MISISIAQRTKGSFCRFSHVHNVLTRRAGGVKWVSEASELVGWVACPSLPVQISIRLQFSFLVFHPPPASCCYCCCYSSFERIALQCTHMVYGYRTRKTRSRSFSVPFLSYFHSFILVQIPLIRPCLDFIDFIDRAPIFSHFSEPANGGAAPITPRTHIYYTYRHTYIGADDERNKRATEAATCYIITTVIVRMRGDLWSWSRQHSKKNVIP
jgi:hypothetical protein